MDGIDNFMKIVAQNIERTGWHCTAVMADQPGDIPFAYTVGLTKTFGVPEIIVFGLNHETAHGLLARCAFLLSEGEPILADVSDARILGGGYCTIFKPVKREALDDYFGTAFRYYGDTPFDALVMVLPDKHKKYPWDAGYDGRPDATHVLRIIQTTH